MRDKLVELLLLDYPCDHESCIDCPRCNDEDTCIRYLKETLADNLIANGVTVQEWINPIEYYPSKNEIILIHDIRGNTYVGPSINTPVGKVGYWMPLPQPPKGE